MRRTTRLRRAALQRNLLHVLDTLLIGGTAFPSGRKRFVRSFFVASHVAGFSFLLVFAFTVDDGSRIP